MAGEADSTRITIGQLSRLTQLSVRMLRYYDEHDVLAPVAIDEQTGYRWYALSQVRDAVRVRTLRDLGFGVGAISGLLSSDADTFQRALRAHRRSVEEDASRANQRLTTIDGLLAHFREAPMTLDIARTTHPALQAVTLRRRIPSYGDEGVLWDELMRALPPAVMAHISGPALAIFHDPEYRESDVDVEIGLPVTGAVEVSEPVVVTQIPALDVVVVTVNGSYDGISKAMSAVATWMDTHGVTVAGPMYNRYLVSPAQTENPDEWVTEVCVPVANT